MSEKKMKIMLTGATGYVGGLLLRRLEAEGHEINCLVRDGSRLQTHSGSVSVFEGDVLEPVSVLAAMEGVDTAYFLVHFLHEKKGFDAKEIAAAKIFVSMARAAGVKRIIYLGGLGNDQHSLSPHLQSRQEVGMILRSSKIPAIEFRASVVLGAGSLSFKLIRDLTEHLPFMVMPRWVSAKAQPIGIRDLLDYLVQALSIDLDESEIIEIGGADQLSYRDLMIEYAKQRGLRRLMIPVPVLTPWLSSHWISFFSSVNPTVARKLIEGIRNPTVVESNRARERFSIVPESASSAIAEAIRQENREDSYGQLHKGEMKAYVHTA